MEVCNRTIVYVWLRSISFAGAGYGVCFENCLPLPLFEISYICLCVVVKLRKKQLFGKNSSRVTNYLQICLTKMCATESTCRNLHEMIHMFLCALLSFAIEG